MAEVCSRRQLPLGDHTFTLLDGLKEQQPVLAVDGEPVQIKKARNKDGTWRWWQYWRVRDLPEIPRRLRGATVHIRHSRSNDDGPRSRSRALRLHPEGSDMFKDLYRRRNDIESMHRHLQDLMFNERAPVIGDRNLRVWLHDYQTRTARNALIAWHYRTGGDISAWFGNWRPPPQRRALAA